LSGARIEGGSEDGCEECGLTEEVHPLAFPKFKKKDDDVCECVWGHDKDYHRASNFPSNPHNRCHVKGCSCKKFKPLKQGDFGVGLFGEPLPYGKPKFEIKDKPAQKKKVGGKDER